MSLKPQSKLVSQASMVLYVTFSDGNKRTFWSRDSEKKEKAGDTGYWYNHLSNMVQTKPDWQGKVAAFAIYRVTKGIRQGDPLLTEKSL